MQAKQSKQLQPAVTNRNVSGGNFLLHKRAAHGQCLHQQAIAHAFIVENLMWVIGFHSY